MYEEESESETGNGESEEEKFPYGYDYSQDAYGTLMERASALLRAYGKCKSWDEKKKSLLMQAQMTLIITGLSHSFCMITQMAVINGPWLRRKVLGTWQINSGMP